MNGTNKAINDTNATGTDFAVRLAAISKTYLWGSVGVEALKSVSLEIYRRSFNVIAGPSGSGKTTLLNVVGCIDSPGSGTVQVCGVDVLSLGDDALSDFRAKNIGFIFQNFNLIPVVSVYENVEYPLLIAREAKSRRRERVLKAIESVGIADLALRRPNELSGGQRQRVAIARALVKEPQIVLADEPTANLDSKTGTAIIELMKKMQAESHCTFIFSSHDRQLFECAEETFTMRDGCLVGHSYGDCRK
ncbi:MAG: ABC transporter ATP-binding protein [Nitrospirae bacterium]|nr:ABC transporter ATP-binding protein [Nitrospirota bacterium]